MLLPAFCRIDYCAPFEHPRFAWISKIANWRPVLQVVFRRIQPTSASELCPIAADTAESGGVILRPTKLFLPVFCRADHCAPFELPRFAWISKMANEWRPVLQVLFRCIRAISASELCPIEGYG